MYKKYRLNLDKRYRLNVDELSKVFWGEAVEILKRCCNSETQIQEVMLVLSGVKRLCRQGRWKEEVEILVECLERLGLVAVSSSFKVIESDGSDDENSGRKIGRENVPKRDAGSEKNTAEWKNSKCGESGGGYFEGGLRVAMDDNRRGRVVVFISKDERVAWLGLYYELVLDHRNMGQLLGYPECCISFFEGNFGKNSVNLELRELYAPLIDISQRTEDVTIVSHFPCAGNCQSSLELARTYLNAIREMWPYRASRLAADLGI